MSSASLKNFDPAFEGAGQKAGLEVWRIQNFQPTPVPSTCYGRFFTGDSYIVLRTTASKSGALHYDIHYWLGKDTSQDESGTAAVKTVELDTALGGRAVQYREIQGHESEKFLSYFRPCIIPVEGGVASGFKHVESEEHQTRLFACRGKHVVRVKEIPFARSSLNHDDIFILDTISKIFQFNGYNSSIQERAKALEVAQYIKDYYHDGKCEMAIIEDGKLMSDAESGDFWALFGGFAPLPRKPPSTDKENDNGTLNSSDTRKLYRVEKGQVKPLEVQSLERETLDTKKCYILDCGLQVYLWMGRSSVLDERKSASKAVEELVQISRRPRSHVIRVMEGFETVMFRSMFDSWTEAKKSAVPEDGRGRVASLLQRQGVNVKGLLKTIPQNEEREPHIDCTGNLQVWRVSGEQKFPLQASDQSKFYTGDCYIFQYNYAGEDSEEYLVGTWFGKQSVEEERAAAIEMASKMVESMKFLPAQARIYEGKEPIQFFVIMQSFIVFKGGHSNGYKKHVAESEINDETFDEESAALFRVQGSGPENMQAIQVDKVASSLNSSYCYILVKGSTVFTWSGNLTSSEDLELVERMLDLIKPNSQSKPQKEGSEFEAFWEVLGERMEYPTQKIGRDKESDPRLLSCAFSNGNLKVVEIFNFTQDDLMTEDIYVLDCQSEIFVWVGKRVSAKIKAQALTIGEKFLEHERISLEAPIYVVMEGSEPPFFTRFFKWDSCKSAMHGNSFERKLAIMRHGGATKVDKPKRRIPLSQSGRASAIDKPQPRSRSMTFSPDRVRVRGRSPAFNALAANFEKPSARNLSTPPPMVKKLIYPKSFIPDASKFAPKSAAIAARTALFETPAPIIDKADKAAGPEEPKPYEDLAGKEDEAHEEEGEARLPTYPYERLKTDSTDPIPDVDVRKREAYLSPNDFKERLGMDKDAFYRLPKWRQNKLKMAIQLF